MSRLIMIVLIIGLVVGGIGGWLIGQPGPTNASPEPTSTNSLPAGWQSVTLPEGFQFMIRETDRITKIKQDDKNIGYRIFDPFAPAPSGPSVDIITTRLAEMYDLPEATTIKAYQEPIEGLKVQDTREATIHGRAALKQLYTATLGQKRSDGAIMKKPVGNLLRYILQGNNDQIVLLKSTGTYQQYLDAIAMSFEFVKPNLNAADNPSVINLDTDTDADVVVPPLENGILDSSSSGLDL